MRTKRLARIVFVAWRYGLDEFAAGSPEAPLGARLACWCARALRLGQHPTAPRGQRLRQALESLGPIFVKFGQVLSTRRDLLPEDIADELAKLQDQVPPFSSELAVREIERGLGRKINECFASFEMVPVASASIAQVHLATLHDGREAAVKVLRPDMQPAIERDLALLRAGASLLLKVSLEARRLRPLEVVKQFDQYLHDELDLIREGANANQLRRNFAGTGLLRVPEIHWGLSATNVLTMERMHGIPISRMERLRAAGIDLKKLSRDGVQIFFTQVFRDGFFHADMHPGNILVGDRPEDFNRYIALDFGIVGTLSDVDKNYVAQNFVAFFRRDYRRIADLHIESGWVPEDTRVDELEGAVRTCCEPVFDRPLKDISLGVVLLRLFQASRRFSVEIQPQLVLLQKTLLNVEGLGRQLDPDLDLWVTAKPILERWMREQVGVTGMIDRIKEEAPQWSRMLPQLPRLVHAVLEQQARPIHQRHSTTERLIRELIDEQRRTRRWVGVVAALTLVGALAIVLLLT